MGPAHIGAEAAPSSEYEENYPPSVPRSVYRETWSFLVPSSVTRWKGCSHYTSVQLYYACEDIMRVVIRVDVAAIVRALTPLAMLLIERLL